MVLKDFEKWFSDRYYYQKKWKKDNGGKIIGYFCTYTPEEIFYAFGLLPVRIMKTHKNFEISNPHIPDMFCNLCRDLLGEILLGRCDHLDGLVIAQSCLHLRQSYTSAEIHKSFPFSHYLCMPNHVQSKRSLDFLIGEYELLIKKLQQFTSKDITDSDLISSIKLLNRVRKVMKEVFLLRKKNPPPINGEDFLYFCCSKFFVDANTWLKSAEKYKILLEEREEKDKNFPKRIMIIGLEEQDVEVIREIERHDCVIVAEESCNSIRYFWDEVDETLSDPIKAIARRNMDKIPCPSKDWPQRTRIQKILNFIDILDIQGVIIIDQFQCHPHCVEIPFIKRSIEDKGCPVYVLKYDTKTFPYGSNQEIKNFLKEIEKTM